MELHAKIVDRDERKAKEGVNPAALHKIDLLQRMTSNGKRSCHHEIANSHLALNIIAALTLGGISLLKSDIEWVKRLLAFRGIPIQIFNSYVRRYAEAVVGELNDHGSIIATYPLQIVREERCWKPFKKRRYFPTGFQ